jgi:hypothetical protein
LKIGGPRSFAPHLLQCARTEPDNPGRWLLINRIVEGRIVSVGQLDALVTGYGFDQIAVIEITKAI